jgi:hypothetical protein
MKNFTSQSPIYDISNIQFFFVQNDPFFLLLLAKYEATHPIFEISSIGDREVKVWIVMHIECIEYFGIGPNLVGLIWREIQDLKSDA